MEAPTEEPAAAKPDEENGSSRSSPIALEASADEVKPLAETDAAPDEKAPIPPKLELEIVPERILKLAKAIKEESSVAEDIVEIKEKAVENAKQEKSELAKETEKTA